MSEEILKALTQLFAIISKQDEGATEVEREFVISFYKQELDKETVDEYLALYDKYSEFGLDEPENEDEVKTSRKKRATAVNESVRVLRLCKDINKTLAQKQKVIVLFKLLEMLAADQNFSAQRMEIIETISNVFKIPKAEYQLIKNFVIQQNPDDPNLDSEDILVFDDERPAGATKLKYIDSGQLNGEIMFVRVKSVDLYFTKYTGTDDIFLNGLLVKKNSILLFSHGSVFKTPKGAPLYYSDLVSRFNSDFQRENISFNVVDLEFRFPSGAIGLRNINISEGTGKLIGIMGASGAGKTTLLNVLAGLEKPSNGKVLINGFNIHDKEQSEHIEGVIGYIAQDDLLIEELTVFQNLYYNAKLCFKDLKEEQIVQKVNDVLSSLGLDRIKDIKVGNVLNKKISGGQRKRLNIALELIREPAVLFVDEPTSGLSSRDSENVIDLLKELSLKGKLIYVVIHQPSSDIYKMFDKMVILDTGGFQIFYGNPVEAITYFKKATRQVGSDRGQCMTCGNVTPEQLFNIVEARVVDEYGEFTQKRKIAPEEWHQMFLQNFRLERVEEVREEPPKNLKVPSRIRQAIIFTVRDFLSKISNMQYMMINLLEAPVLALLMALVIRFKNAAGVDEYLFRYNDNIPAYMLICIIIALFMGLTVSAEEIIRDRKILKRESFLNLSRISYLSSKVVILFTLSAVQTLSFVLIGNFILDIQDVNIMYWTVLFSVSCFANVLGLNISSAFNSAVTVYILIPLLLIPQMILSGAIFNFDKLNNAITEKGKVPVIADFWASRWAYEAIAVEQFRSNPYEKLFYEIDKQKSVANFKVSFWFPKMEELITGTLNYKQNKEIANKDSLRRLINDNLTVLRNELYVEASREEFKAFRKEAEAMQLDKLLSADAFNEEAAAKTKGFLEKIRDGYNLKFVMANDARDSLMYVFEKKGKDAEATLAKLKEEHFNENLNDVVTNINSKERVAINKGRIVQLVDPVFHTPELPELSFDYRAQFFAPQKHFMGRFFDTYYFNTAVIWIMTIVLYITLYFELLKKAIDALGKIKIGKSGD